jgi:hypothetical protein
MMRWDIWIRRDRERQEVEVERGLDLVVPFVFFWGIFGWGLGRMISECRQAGSVGARRSVFGGG